MNVSLIKNISKVLRSGWTVLIAVSIGIYIGLYKHEYVEYVAPIGHIYLDILKMCILPILITAISVSIARLMQSEGDNTYITRMLIVFAISVVVSGFLGLTLGMISQPGSGYDDATLASLGSIVRESGAPDLEISAYEPFVAKEKQSFIKTFVVNLIPENIFSALTSGSSLKVLFFAILFGSAIGSLNKDSSHALLSSLESVYLAFAKMVKWLMFFLPFGLLGLIAHDVSQVGVNVLMAMMKFVPIALLGFFLLFILSSLIMWQRTGSFIRPFLALKDTIVMALGTGNALACLPSALSAMHEKLGYDKKTVDLLVPLTFTICRTGPTLYFALATLFVAQLYKVDLGISGLFTVIMGSIFAGLATAGASGVILLSMLSLVLAPLNLPVEAVLVLFIVIDPIIGPFRVLTIVHTACAIITLILPKQVPKLKYGPPIPVESNS
ncbi:MAG: cation:dicarboxylase symporter family transporter [Methylobacter sp.]|uniref:dicarboxylate/amino acid:cation symporter n=1 Tax=Methylobacter sp. TaxID=2051955 RepID=UPI00271B8920|nr:cation:dicarboxylase symporter family transporter [Methylobacter sp.]MDO9270193.1 cation:dicarboxylase symporter family transporter [Methylobacter sp.]MDP1666288.1 cation:dicarboxylase symporter family transporter [Methylobacter sp.]